MARPDLAIARGATLEPLGELATALGLPAHPGLGAHPATHIVNLS